MSEETNPWLWFYADSEDAEIFHLGGDTREITIDVAKEHFEGDELPAIYIGQARFAEPGFKFFSADDVLVLFEEHNEEIWCENGPEFSFSADAEGELEQVLSDAFRAWSERHGNKWRLWSLADWRNTETIVLPEALQV